jgi:uncharacterized integral membrane protein
VDQDPQRLATGQAAPSQSEPYVPQPYEQPLPDVTTEHARQKKMAPTRASASWAAVVGGLIVLVLLIVFVSQNTQSVRVSLFTAHWHTPLGIAMLLAAAIGGLVVVFAGAARILELRRRARTEQRRARQAAGATQAGSGS